MNLFSIVPPEILTVEFLAERNNSKLIQNNSRNLSFSGGSDSELWTWNCAVCNKKGNLFLSLSLIFLYGVTLLSTTASCHKYTTTTCNNHSQSCNSDIHRQNQEKHENLLIFFAFHVYLLVKNGDLIIKINC